MARKKSGDDVKAPKNVATAPDKQSDASLEETGGSMGRQRRLIESLRQGIAKRDGTIQQLEATLELEGRISATLRESLRKLGDRITQLEDAFSPGGPGAAAALDGGPDAGEAAGGQEGMRIALERVTVERDQLRDQLRALERMQTETVTLPEDAMKRSAFETAHDVQPTIDELLDSLSSVERPPVLSLTGLPGSTPNGGGLQADGAEVWREMLAPEIMAPEAFEADDSTAEKPIARMPEDAGKVYGFFVALDGERPIRHPLRKQVTTVGRAPSCDIQINANYISRVHARILSDESSIVIEDAGSKNGLRINAEAAERHVMRPGDVVGLGPLRFEVHHGPTWTEPRSDAALARGHTEPERESQPAPEPPAAPLN
jgi:FHA domain